MAGKDKFDDGTRSIESFEEVGDMKAISNISSVARTEDQAAVKVPDIRYILRYKNARGNIIDSRESDKPFDIVDNDTHEETSTTNKPIFEIITNVQNIKKRRSGVNDADSVISESVVSTSDSEDSDDEEYDIDNMKVRKVGADVMVVHSEHLLNAFNAVIGTYTGTNFLGKSVTIEAPYQPLVHYRNALSRYRVAQPDCHDYDYANTTAKHIDVLLGYLDKTYGDEIREEEARHKKSTPTATSGWFWLLLKPGEVIYRQIQNVWMPFVIGNVMTYPCGDSGNTAMHSISCWDISFSMGRMRRCGSQCTIQAFSGEQAIHTLDIIPAAFFPDDLKKQGGLTMSERQIQMGKLYWELVKRPAYKEYDGDLVERGGMRGGKVTGRVIIDADGYDRFAGGPMGNPHSFQPPPPPPPPPGARPRHMIPPVAVLPQFRPQCFCAKCQCDCSDCRGVNRDRDAPGPWAGFDNLNPLEEEPPKNDLYFLVCSSVIPAFVLASRRWGHVSLAHLSEVKCDTEAFKYLVLDDGVKLTVKALIGKFASTDGKVSPWPNDFVRNKGEGRIFLLHGSPGVGKTCTAECVAELARRPLLSITSGDLLPHVERSLGYFLTLGERYGALVLLDEADVYLEERRTRDLRRNALVSVFLRALEYYRGVLFLTTNRVQSFDPAFTSRIHVALHYRRLTDEDRHRIWANNFDRLERDSVGKVVVSHSAHDYVFDAREVSTLRWNGREIRNALQTAVALAETEAVEEGLETVVVAERHLKQVVKMSRGFKEFLKKRKGYGGSNEDDDDDNDGIDGDISGENSEEEGEEDGRSEILTLEENVVGKNVFMTL